MSADVLVIGGGGAGLRAAIEAARAGVKVLMIAKGRVGYSCNTGISGGGLAASIDRAGSSDSSEIHLKDTLLAGRFINDKTLVEEVVRGIPQQVEALISFGAAFLHDDGELQLLERPGHSFARGISAEHSSGQDISVPLRKYALKMGVKMAEGTWVTHLLERDGVVIGAVGIDREGKVTVYRSRAIVLATGGSGQIYKNTTNAGGIVGDGYALAYNLGLKLCDMEFVQFYPTALGKLGRKVLFYEVLVSGLGAVLRNSLGEDIPQKYGIKDPALMTRDRLAQAIFQEISAGRDVGGGVVMDLSSIPSDMIKKAKGLPFRTRIDEQQVIVVPTSHFFMGGLKINRLGQTEIEGLWAAGEICSGVHGANRLTGNAISEIIVFGAIAGREAAKWASGTSLAEPASTELADALNDIRFIASSQGKEAERVLRQQLKSTMWLQAGIVRNRDGLKHALARISSITQDLGLIKVEEPSDLLQVVELHNMLVVSEMVCRAALIRKESRGAHFRNDYPEEDDANWLRNITISCRNANMELESLPVL